MKLLPAARFLLGPAGGSIFWGWDSAKGRVPGRAHSPGPTRLPGKGKEARSEGNVDVLPARPQLLLLTFRELQKLI